VADGGLDQRHQLGFVAREAASDEARAELERDADQVDGVVGVGDTAL